MTPIETLWEAVEAEAQGAGPDKWIMRRVLPHGAHDLSIGIETPGGRRLLLLRTQRSVLPQTRALPDCRGFDVFVRQGATGAEGVLGVALKESRFADVFTALITDLTARVAAARSASDAVAALLGHLRRWQTFLAAAAEGLGEEARRGLWGELHFLREHLLPTLGLAAVAFWKGPRRAHQDFQFSTGAIEVKASAAKNPQTVRITSERQLDDTGVPALFLHHLSLDAREGGGESLPAMVESVRARLAGGAGASDSFEEALLASGWLDIHSNRYAGCGYTVRESNFFRVTPDFPRIVEAALPDGVGEVSYALSIVACAPFSVSAAEVLNVVGGNPNP